MVQFEEHGQIGKRAKVEDGETHTMHAGLTQLRKTNVENADIVLGVDNQNAQRALAGGPTGGQEYVQACLEEVRILQHRSCRIKGMWTPFHKGIVGNEQADTLIKKGTTDPPCAWTRVTLTWLRTRLQQQCMEKWT